jgi:DnaK suppressor protein
MATANTSLSDEQLQSLRRRLEERRRELDEEISNLTSDIQAMTQDELTEGGTGGNHPGDEGSDVRDAEQSLTIQQDLEAMRRQVIAALERMDEGTYGLCQQCGKPIDPERLDALPHAAYDIKHQAEMERNAGL